MGTNTPNLQLYMSNDDGSENVIVATQINDNWEKIDTAYGNMLASIPTVKKAYKLAATPRTNDTLAPDDHLFISGLAISEVWAVESYLFYNGIAGAGIKFDWTLPAGATMDWSSFGTNGHAGGTLVDYDVVSVQAAGGRTHGTNGVGINMSLQPKGVLHMGATPGTAALRFAQATTNATATNLGKGSWIRFTKLS